jgi:cholesterol transport system auxiliary component
MTRLLPAGLPVSGSVACLALLLSGCVSILPEPVIPEALIALPADRAMASASPLRADIVVFPPDATKAYSGVDIAVRTDQEIIYLSAVRWVDSAPRLLQGAVIDALVRSGGEGRAVPAQLAARGDYDLRWRIVDLSTGKDSLPVHVVVDANLVDSGTRRILQQKRFETTGTPRSGSARDRAAALALAVQQASDQVASFVAEYAVPVADTTNVPPRPPAPPPLSGAPR